MTDRIESNTEFNGRHPTDHLDRSAFIPLRLLGRFLFGTERLPWPIVVLFMATVVLYSYLVFVAYGFTIDDAYMSARYAKNLAISGQLTWNVGEIPRTEGYTSPLWVLLSSVVFIVLDSFPFRPIQLMGVFFGVLALITLLALARKLRISSWCVTLPALFLSLTAPFVLWSVSGMENALYVFLILLGLYLVTDEEEHGLNYVTPVVFFLVTLARTEGIVFYLSVVFIRCALYVLNRDQRKVNAKKLLIWHGIFLSCLTTYILWKTIYYGSVLPLPVLIKKPADFSGLAYVVSFVGQNAPFLVLALLGLRSGADPRKMHLWGALGAYLLAISCSNPIMGYDQRLIVAAFPLVYVLAVWELDQVLTGGHNNASNALLLVLIALFLSLTIVKNPATYVASLRNKADASTQVLGLVHIPLGTWLDRQPGSPGAKKVALADAGAIAFYFDGVIIDLYGLNDREIAHEGFSAQRVLERKPDYVVLNSKTETHFEGNDTPCGKMSEDLFRSDLFPTHYAFVRQFVSHNPFYSLWVYARRPDRASP